MVATKLAKGGIYGNFKSKEEICSESFLYLTKSLSGKLDKAAQQGKTAKARFFNLLDSYKSNKTTDGGCPLLNFGVEADDTNLQMKEKVKKAIRASQKRIFDIVSDAVANNEVSPEINPKNFSIKVFAMIEGAILCRRILDSNEQMNVVIEAIKKEFENYQA
jgi:dihydroxyacetone kinase DhaKLM complex PTS-EIIA-like component DhaM